jgi:hypothetical protein
MNGCDEVVCGHAYAIEQWAYAVFFRGRGSSFGRSQVTVVMRGYVSSLNLLGSPFKCRK